MGLELFDSEVDLTTPVDTSKVPAETKQDEPDKTGDTTSTTGEEDTVVDSIDDVKGSEKPEDNTTTDDTGGDGTETDDTGETKDTDTTTEETPSGESADSSKFPYSTFAKALYEEGVLTSFDEEEFSKLAEESGEVEALFSLIGTTINGEVDKELNKFSPEQRDVIDAIGKGVSLEKYLQVKAKQQNYSSVKVEELSDDDSLCKRLIEDDLVARGYSSEEIKETIEDIDSLGKLEARGKSSLKRLQKTQADDLKKSKEDADKRNRDLEIQNKQALSNLRTSIDRIKEVIPGMKVNAPTKNKMYEALTTPAAQTADGQYLNSVYAKRAQDPSKFDLTLAYLYTLGVFDGKWDKISASAKSGAVADLEKKLKGGDVSKTGDPAIATEKSTSKDILRSMKIFEKKKY